MERTEIRREPETWTTTGKSVSEIRETESTLPHATHHHRERRVPPDLTHVVGERAERVERMERMERPRIEQAEPTVLVEHREKGAVIREHIHPKEREEIQPIIHREREKTELVQVAKPIMERDVRPTMVEEKTLPAETRPTVFQGESEEFKRMYREKSERYKSTTEFSPVEKEVIEKPPIIKEHVTRKIIEEIQPVVYREITEPHIIREVKPIYEKVIEGPVLLESKELPMEQAPRYEYREYPTTYEKREYLIPKKEERREERLIHERERKEKKTTKKAPSTETIYRKEPEHLKEVEYRPEYRREEYPRGREVVYVSREPDYRRSEEYIWREPRREEYVRREPEYYREEYLRKEPEYYREHEPVYEFREVKDVQREPEIFKRDEKIVLEKESISRG